MEHNISLITTIAAGFGLALVLGVIASRLKLPALVGYLLAGVVLGPFTPGFVADAGLAAQLAEIGVMLLMFGVGLHFSLDDLLAVRKIAVPGAVVQMLVATLMGMGLATWWGWGIGQALVFGIALSVASTVVLLRALESRELLHTGNGRIAVGWLVVEDLAMVLALVLIPVLGGKGGDLRLGDAALQPLDAEIGDGGQEDQDFTQHDEQDGHDQHLAGQPLQEARPPVPAAVNSACHGLNLLTRPITRRTSGLDARPEK